MAKKLRRFVLGSVAIFSFSSYASEFHSEIIVKSDDSCQVIQNIDGYIGAPGLSPLWAQEICGIDLALETLNSVQNRAHIQAGVLEDMDVDHAAKVTNLICSKNEKTPISLGRAPYIETVDGVFNPLPASAKNTSQLSPFEETLPTLPPQLRVLNISRPMPTNKDKSSFEARRKHIDDRVQSLSSTNGGISIVTSAGNSHLKGDEISPNKQNPNLIVVGNLGPAGLIHSTSDSGDFVTLQAPAGRNFQLSMNKKNSFDGFGGTSGATPLASGVIASLYSIMPELDNSDIQKILKKTSLPSLASVRSGDGNGVGLINAYKSIQTILRIRDQCNFGETKEKKDCIKRKLNTNSTFEFELKSLASNISKAKSLWPQCGNGFQKNGINDAKNCERKQLLEELRRSSLLIGNPNSEVNQTLACIYKAENFPENALLYESLDLALKVRSGLKPLSEISSFAKKTLLTSTLEESRHAALRELIEHSPQTLKELDFSKKDLGFSLVSYLKEARSDASVSLIKNTSPEILYQLLENYLLGTNYSSIYVDYPIENHTVFTTAILRISNFEQIKNALTQIQHKALSNAQKKLISELSEYLASMSQ